MSKTWKWILGILAALVIIGVVAAAVFVWWNHSPLTLRSTVSRPQVSGTPAPNSPYGPMMPYGYENGRRYHMDGWGWHMPMMWQRGYPGSGGFGRLGWGFFILGGLLRLLIPVGILVLVAILFYQLGKRAGAPSAPAPSMPAPDKAPLPGRKVARR